MSWHKLSGTILIGIFLTWNPLSLSAEADMDAVERSVICTCGCPNMVLNTCMCDHAEQMRVEIRALIDEGKTEEEVIQSLVKRYGEVILASPTKEGFNLMAYVAPFLAILFGGGIIVALIRRWKGHGGGESEEFPEVQQVVDDDPYRKKLVDELESFKD